MAHILPDLAHLPAFLAVLVAAVLCGGLGALAGARSAEVALVSGWGLAYGLALVCGTLLRIDLSYVLAALAVAGAAGVCFAARRARPVAGLALCVLLLAVPLLFVTESMDSTGWDDLSHWLPNLTYLCQHGGFPTAAAPNAFSYHAAYPYAEALPGYASFLIIGRVPESAALVWNTLLMLCACAAIARLLLRQLEAACGRAALGRGAPWLAAAVGLLVGGLACPTFVPKILFSNMADSATAAVMAVLGALLTDWFAAAGVGARRRVALLIGLCAVALVGLRQSNAALLGLLVIGAGAAWLSARRVVGPGVVQSLLVALVLPVLARLLWQRYAAAEIPAGAFRVLAPALWHWAELPGTLFSILKVILQKPGLFALIAVLLVRATAFTLRPRADGMAAHALVLIAAVVGAGNIAFLMFSYLATDFSAEEAGAAASFWRYNTQVGPLVVLGAVACVPAAWLRRIRLNWVLPVGIAAAVLLPLALARVLRFDLDSPLPAIRRVAADIDREIPAGAPLLAVDNIGNGYVSLALQYQIEVAGPAARHWHGPPPRHVDALARPAGLAPGDLTLDRFRNYRFIWLAAGSTATREVLHVPLNAACSYLVSNDAAGFAVLSTTPARLLVAKAGGALAGSDGEVCK